MKVLQITLLVLVFGIFANVDSFSQNYQKKTPEDIAKQQTSWMKQEINLTPDQEKKVYDLNLETIKNMRAARDQHMGDREAMQAEMKKNRMQKDKALQDILSDEQYKLYKQKVKELREQRKGKNKGMK